MDFIKLIHRKPYMLQCNKGK